MQWFNSLVARAIPFIPRVVVRSISRRYIAGHSLDDALARARQLEAQGFGVTLDILGEGISTWQEAEHAAEAYLRSLEAIGAERLRADLSVKPSSLGLLLDPLRCEARMIQVLEAAQRHGAFVCIDMEDLRCTQAEIDLFLRLRVRYANVGLALQAYLRRSHQDIETLVQARAVLRICKGIYVEAPSHLVDGAAKDRRAINDHFLHHVARCFDSGAFVAIATHDAALVDQVVALAATRRIAPASFEFQMLLGVCEPLRDRLRAAGFGVRIYVPYGADWYAYSTRRLKENPRIAGHVLRATLGF